MLMITCTFSSATVRIIPSLIQMEIPDEFLFQCLFHSTLGWTSLIKTFDRFNLFFNNASDPTGSDYETYLYGIYDAGWSVYTPGNELALRFESNERYPGFQLVYYQLDPGE